MSSIYSQVVQYIVRCRRHQCKKKQALVPVTTADTRVSTGEEEVESNLDLHLQKSKIKQQNPQNLSLSIKTGKGYGIA